MSKLGSLDDIFRRYLNRHGVYDIPDETESLSPAYKIGCLMLETTAFSVSAFYEILKGSLSYNSLRAYLSLLTKEKMIRKNDVSGDDEVRAIYYLTKKGYDCFSSYVGRCSEYRPVPKKRKEYTGIHDLGTSNVYLSMIHSPFYIHPYYESVFAHDKKIMPTGKQYRNALRPDLSLYYMSNRNVGWIFNEHDTGSETIINALGKLSMYKTHNLMKAPYLMESGCWASNLIFYSTRRAYPNKPKCFQKREIHKLLALMDGETRINTLRKSEVGPIVRSFEKWTPAIAEKWDRKCLEKHLSDMERRTNQFYYDYLLKKQEHFAYSRRNGMLEYIILEFDRNNDLWWDDGKYTNRYYYQVMVESEREKGFFYKAMELEYMMKGFPVIVCPYNAIERFMKVFFMEEHSDMVNWVTSVLRPIYGEVEYWRQWMGYVLDRYDRPKLRAHNIFKSHDDMYIAVEYLSCDMSAIVRLYAMHVYMRKESENYHVLYVVDSVDDAKQIMSFLGIECYDWMHFIECGKEELFYIDTENNAVYMTK